MPNNRLRKLAAGCLATTFPLAGASEMAGAGDRQVLTVAATTPACPVGSLEGQYTKSTIQSYVDCVVQVIENFFFWQFNEGIAAPENYYFVPTNETGPTPCTNPDGSITMFDDMSLFYCGPNRSIYFGQEVVWLLYSQQGDIAPMVVAAHEWGHHVQHETPGLSGPATPEASIVYENQADCMSGAWLGYENFRGTLEFPDDVGDLDALMAISGSAAGPGRDHGTTQERIDSLNRGFGGGMFVCNDYYPNSPIIVAR